MKNILKISKSLTRKGKQQFCGYKPKQSVFEMLGANPLRAFAMKFGKLEQENPKCINMAVGVPIDATPSVVVNAKKEWVDMSAKEGCNGYGDPKGMDTLRHNLQEYYTSTYNLSPNVITPDHFTITTGGSSHSLSLSFELLMRGSQGKGQLIILAPFFGPYVGMVKLANGQEVIVDTDKDFLPDLQALEAAITPDTKAILINSPNNPTGKVYSKQSIQAIIDLARKYNVAIVSDEVYEKFVYHPQRTFHSLIEFFDENRDVLLITNTSPSKTYGMIGDRIGYTVSNQPDFNRDLQVTLGYRFASAPYIAQYALNSVFKKENRGEIEEYLNKMNRLYKEKGEVLVEGMRGMGFKSVEIEGGMFLMVEVKSVTGLDGTQLSQYMINQECPLAITPGIFFGPKYQDYIRLTICSTKHTLQKGCKQMALYLQQLKQSK